MNHKDLMLSAIILSVSTSFVGLILFLGSMHSGGTSFYVGMFLMPPLYLFNTSLALFGNFTLDIMLVLFLQYILCLLLVYLFNKLKNIRLSNGEG